MVIHLSVCCFYSLVRPSVVSLVFCVSICRFSCLSFLQSRVSIRHASAQRFHILLCVSPFLFEHPYVTSGVLCIHTSVLPSFVHTYVLSTDIWTSASRFCGLMHLPVMHQSIISTVICLLGCWFYDLVCQLIMSRVFRPSLRLFYSHLYPSFVW